MAQIRTARLFQNGGSQAVRLPAEFRFKGREVYIHRDAATGDVVLSQRRSAGTWSKFFDFLKTVDLPAEFMNDRPMNVPAQGAGIFDRRTPPYHRSPRKRS